MNYYHRTNAAEAIIRDGFRDAEGSYMHVGITLRGVWISDVPLDGNEGAKGDQLFEIKFSPDFDISEYELIEEEKPYREWCVPAEVVNRNGSVRLVSKDEEWDMPF
jgi:hypothetical protein